MFKNEQKQSKSEEYARKVYTTKPQEQSLMGKEEGSN